MKLKSFAMILFASVFSIQSGLAGQLYSGKIKKLSDGDTFQFSADGESKPFKVRMIGIDTAETHLAVSGGIVSQGYWGDRGSEQLAEYISVGDEAVLEVFGEDKYKRKLGRVFKNGEDINLKMLRSGWASLYMMCESGEECRTGSLPADELEAYREGCREGVSNGRGLFDPSNPVPELPFVFRANKSGYALSKFVADLSSNTYVGPYEYEQVSVCDRLFYLSEEDAIRNGFTSQN